MNAWTHLHRWSFFRFSGIYITEQNCQLCHDPPPRTCISFSMPFQPIDNGKFEMVGLEARKAAFARSGSYMPCS
jgi:hypothetical protein